MKEIPKLLGQIKDLVKQDPQEGPAIADLTELCMSALSTMDECRRVCHAVNDRNDITLQYKFLLGQKSQEYGKQSAAILNFFTQEQESSSKEHEQSRTALHTLLMCGLAGNVLLALLAAVFLVKGITGRLQTLANNTLKLAAGKPLDPPLPGGDEIAVVDRAFHNMARELVESARKESAVIENARELICSIGANDQFAKVNPAALSVLGYEQDDLLGRRFIDIVYEEDRQKTRQFLKSAMMDQSHEVLEARLLRRDGTAVDVVWSAYWSQEERSYFCVIQDISARKQIERMKQEFVAMVSHDLRTPLTAIKGTLYLINQGAVDLGSERGRRRVNDAEKSAERLMKLVNDLLDIEKMEGGKLVLDIDYVNMEDVVRRSLESVHAFAEQSQIEIETRPCSVEVMADEDRLVQVLVNLLSNAVKFSPAQSRISITSASHNGHCE
ncbi:MAG: sensor histidine kinase, partial [Terriglobales bacterium]